MTTYMNAIATRNFGISPSFDVVHKPIPQPKKNEVLVKVLASSINPKDWKLNTLISGLIPKLGFNIPALMGDDLSGEVVEVGSQAKSFQVGDKVYGMDMSLRTRTAAEYAVISEESIAFCPSNLSDVETAGVPLAALTAYQGLNKFGLKADHKVLIIGASGGVGTFALQMAKAMGAEVTAVCSGKNFEWVRRLGADHLIDYTVEDYLLSDKSYDLVFDVTSYQTPYSVKKLIKKDGMFISTGGQVSKTLPTLLAKFTLKDIRTEIILVKSIRQHLDAIKLMIEEEKVKVIIDSQYDLKDYNQAIKRSQSGRAKGKIVVKVSDS